MAEYIEHSVGASVLRAKANMAVLMDAAPYFEKAAQILEKLPAADVAPVVHGRWVRLGGNNRRGENHATIFECSACEKCDPYKSDYCPNCGARMDKEDDYEAD